MQISASVGRGTRAGPEICGQMTWAEGAYFIQTDFRQQQYIYWFLAYSGCGAETEYLNSDIVVPVLTLTLIIILVSIWVPLGLNYEVEYDYSHIIQLISITTSQANRFQAIDFQSNRNLFKSSQQRVDNMGAATGFSNQIGFYLVTKS